MEMFPLKEERLKEVRSFLLFHGKVLRSQRNRVVMENEEEPTYVVSKNMDYELQKLLDFLTMHPDLKSVFQQEIEAFTQLREELKLGKALEELEAAHDFFEQIHTILDKLKQRELKANEELPQNH